MPNVMCSLKDCIHNENGVCGTDEIDITESGCEDYEPGASAPARPMMGQAPTTPTPPVQGGVSMAFNRTSPQGEAPAPPQRRIPPAL